MAEEIKLAYMAGLFDGEGTFTLVQTRSRNPKHNDTVKPVAFLCNTNRELVELCTEKWGNARKLRLNRQINEKHKPVYRWESAVSKTASVCRDLLPYLVAKKKQAELVLVFAEHKQAYVKKVYRGRPLSPGTAFFRQLLLTKIRQLNKRGVSA